jgi:Leucine-rich repeat (LRR) protein
MQIEDHQEEIVLQNARDRITVYLNQLKASQSPDQSHSPRASLRFTNFSPRIPGNLPRLDLSSCHLTDQCFKQLLPELQQLPMLTELNLGDNFLTGEGVTLLAQLFPQLEFLAMSKNKLFEHQGCHQLSHFKKLRTLEICSNSLKSVDIEELNASESLQIVKLSDNPKVDFVRHAKLLAGCDYNKKMLRQQFYKSEALEETKTEYILNNWESFKRRSLERTITPPSAKY